MRGTFRLREAIVAVRPSPEGNLTITVPHGAVLRLLGEPLKSGLVDVLWNGHRIAVFIQDINSRGEVIEVASAGA